MQCGTTSGHETQVSHRHLLINYNFPLCICKKIFQAYVIHILRNENNLFFLPHFLKLLGGKKKKKKNLKRIMSFNTELISQLNLGIEIMCQMAWSTCSVERLQFYSCKKKQNKHFPKWSPQQGREFVGARSNNAIFDRGNDNSFECINWIFWKPNCSGFHSATDSVISN